MAIFEGRDYFSMAVLLRCLLMSYKIYLFPQVNCSPPPKKSFRDHFALHQQTWGLAKECRFKKNLCGLSLEKHWKSPALKKTMVLTTSCILQRKLLPISRVSNTISKDFFLRNGNTGRIVFIQPLKKHITLLKYSTPNGIC